MGLANPKIAMCMKRSYCQSYRVTVVATVVMLVAGRQQDRHQQHCPFFDGTR